jgi:hypothetical protein
MMRSGGIAISPNMATDQFDIKTLVLKQREYHASQQGVFRGASLSKFSPGACEMVHNQRKESSG